MWGTLAQAPIAILQPRRVILLPNPSLSPQQ